MVKKYYFQSLNGGLTFVHYGTKEELKAKVDKEYGGDKAEALKNIDAGIKAAEQKLSELEEKLKGLSSDSYDYCETQTLIWNYKASLIKENAEKKRVEKEAKPDLAFFEMTPIEL